MKRKAKRTIPGRSNEVVLGREKGASTYDGMGTSMPPNKDAILIYFDQKGEAQLADTFYDEHENRAWKTPTGGAIHNWKVCAAEWIYNYRQEVKRRFRQSPFYSESI
ncbi:hypothetical protein [Mucilaginibacter defluvii]|uniref:Uncharacterized protein n=1 Tax=Mucilaginibacter defluvii TaxID=1196019 RepID=A0ABP9G005_9SPHI